MWMRSCYQRKIIVVVCGMNKEEYLDSVEYLDLREKPWKELPPMSTKRFLPTASLLPTF